MFRYFWEIHLNTGLFQTFPAIAYNNLPTKLFGQNFWGAKFLRVTFWLS